MIRRLCEDNEADVNHEAGQIETLGSEEPALDPQELIGHGRRQAEAESGGIAFL
jgi:hypothetical protein